jgi:DnaK suppressor protein
MRVIHHGAVIQKEPIMDKQHATPYQQQLVAMRTALLAQMAEQRGGEVSRAEAASAHFSHSEESPAQMATEKEIEFSAITAALARIEAGTYGECTDCGVTIPAARLKATPEAARCIHCQEAWEKKHPL